MKMIPDNYYNIPKDLRSLPQWVCSWNSSKCPMRAFELKAASSSNPATWSTFDQAVSAVEHDVYEHVGFVFNDNGIVGIDVDVGFEDGILTPLGADLIGICESYTEISKSGRGFHIFVRGSLPFSGKNNRHGVEIYQSKRFFITTGNVLLFSEIKENQKAIDYILKTYFDEKISEKHTKTEKNTFYSPVFQFEKSSVIRVGPSYPKIDEGCRNLSLTSLAGQLYAYGLSRDEILSEILRVNRLACKPPLPVSEVKSIVKSIFRYERK